MKIIIIFMLIKLITSQLQGEDDNVNNCIFSKYGSEHCKKLCNSTKSIQEYDYFSSSYKKIIKLKLNNKIGNKTQYSCNVNYNSKNKMYNITFKDKNNYLDLNQPIIVLHLTYIFLPKGNTIQLNCNVYSKFPYNLTWEFNDKFINHYNLTGLTNKFLIQNSNSSHHSGTYYCKIKNKFGSEIVQTQVLVF